MTTPITRGSTGNGCLRIGVEQALGGQPHAQHLDPRQQRAGAGIFHPLDDHLVRRPFAVSGDAAGGDHLDAVLGRQAKAGDRILPDDAGEFGALVLEREIDVAGRIALHLGNFAAHANAAELALQRAFDRAGDFRDGELRAGWSG